MTLFAGLSLVESNSAAMIPKILILTQARSGSTYLSASPNSYFIDEPFQRITVDKIELDVLLNNDNTMANNFVKIMLKDLFKCNYQPDRISVWNLDTENYKRYIPLFQSRKIKNVGNCHKSSVKIIKVIRVRYKTIKSWIADTNIKVWLKDQKSKRF